LSVLTKVFVVLVTVLSVAMAAMVTAYVANQDNYRAQFEQVRTEKNALDARAKELQAQLSAADSSKDAAVAQEKAQLGAAQQYINTQGIQLADLQAQKSAEVNKNAAFEATIKGKDALIQMYAGTQTADMDELKKLREGISTAERKVVELLKANGELGSDKEALKQQFRLLQQQLAAVSDDRDGLQKNWDQVSEMEKKRILAGAGGPVAAGVVVLEPPVWGKVTNVNTVAGKTYVQVSVGKADRVVPNAAFWIYRGNDQFLGRLIIRKVDDSAAAGDVELENGTIAVGDSVRSISR
jgi:hypothetical protein